MLQEEKCVKHLLLLSQSLYNHSLQSTVDDNSSEVFNGWKLAHPRPLYQLNKPKKKKHPIKAVNNNSSRTLLQNKTSHEYTFTMGGRLNENYDYVFDGGLSSKVSGSTSSLHNTTYQPAPQITLKPILVNQCSSSLVEKHRQGVLSHVARLQLKPDISYERMVIEQRLKSMNLHRQIGYRVPCNCLNPKMEIPIQVLVHDSGHNAACNNKTVKRKHKQKKAAFDWNTLNQTTAAFKKDAIVREPLLRTSFSRLLESSSVRFSYKTTK